MLTTGTCDSCAGLECNGGGSRSHFSSFIFLQTILVCPVFESITVVKGTQLQDTVLAFSCLTTTQCSMISAVAGGNWLRIGAGVGAAGCFFDAQPARSRQSTSQDFLIPLVFALWRDSVYGNLGYTANEITSAASRILGHRPSKLALVAQFVDRYPPRPVGPHLAIRGPLIHSIKALRTNIARQNPQERTSKSGSKKVSTSGRYQCKANAPAPLFRSSALDLQVEVDPGIHREGARDSRLPRPYVNPSHSHSVLWFGSPEKHLRCMA